MLFRSRSAGLENQHSPGNIRICAGSGDGVLEISSETEIQQLTIYDILGNPIRNNKVNSRSISIDLSSQATGIYIIKINGNGWTVFRKYEL